MVVKLVLTKFGRRKKKVFQPSMIKQNCFYFLSLLCPRLKITCREFEEVRIKESTGENRNHHPLHSKILNQEIAFFFWKFDFWRYKQTCLCVVAEHKICCMLLISMIMRQLFLLDLIKISPTLNQINYETHDKCCLIQRIKNWFDIAWI